MALDQDVQEERIQRMSKGKGFNVHPVLEVMQSGLAMDDQGPAREQSL